MKEYKVIGEETTFVMLDTQRFSLKFGDYEYGGYFPIGTRRKIKKEVKEVVFDLYNTITVGKLPTHLGMSRFTVNGITKIIV